MAIDYEIIVKGNILGMREGFLALANLTLISTPEDMILFDTGHYSNRSQLLAGLKQRGLTPADVGKVFLSHLHFDHSHNIDLFPDAAVYVSKREWEYARQPHERDISMPWLIHDQLQNTISGWSKARVHWWTELIICRPPATPRVLTWSRSTVIPRGG